MNAPAVRLQREQRDEPRQAGGLTDYRVYLDGRWVGWVVMDGSSAAGGTAAPLVGVLAGGRRQVAAVEHRPRAQQSGAARAALLTEVTASGA
jgi:hypothetical protein